MDDRPTHPLLPGLVPPEGVRGLLFDCDGTLIDTLGAYKKAWRGPFAKHGFDMSDDWFDLHAGLSVDPFIEAALPRATPAERTQVSDDGFATFFAQTHLLEAFDRVVDVARTFHGKVPLAVVSGGTRHAVELSLDAVGIRDLFDFVVTLDDVREGKPSPDGYLLALELLGLESAHCCAYEDTDSGITAASLAGIPVVDVRPHT